MDGKIRCTQEDLDNVIMLFRESIEAELKDAPGNPLDFDRMVLSFRELVTQNMEIVPSFGEDQRAQQLRNEIDGMQRRAVRMKSSLQSKRINFIEAVQSQAEQMLEEKRPVIDDSVSLEELEIPNEIELNLKAIDDAITTLNHQIQQAKNSTSRKLPKYDEFCASVQKFLDDCT